MSSFYDNAYNRSLTDDLLTITRAKELTDKTTPLSFARGGSLRNTGNIDPSYYINVKDSDKYIQSASGASYPMFNSTELNEVNKIKFFNAGLYPLQGGKMVATRHSDGSTAYSGGFGWGDVASFLKPVASTVLDMGATALGAYTGQPALTKAVREGVRNVSGVGLKGKVKKVKPVKGVGIYGATSGGAKSGGINPISTTKVKIVDTKKTEAKLLKAKAKEELKVLKAEQKARAKADKQLAKANKPVKMKVVKEPKMKVVKAPKEPKMKVVSVSVKPSKGNDRAKIVKDVMNKMGLKLIDASKYVKSHNLYQKK